MDTMIVTKRYTVQVPDENSPEFEGLLDDMIQDQDDDLHQFAMRVETSTWLDKRDLLALWMIEKYHGGDFTDKVQDWDYNIEGSK